MHQACRNALKDLISAPFDPGKKLSHPGLLLDSYLSENGDDNKAKRELLLSAASAVAEAKGIYELAFKRWDASVAACARTRMATDGRLIIGLGIESILETGLRLHYTYGVPLLPGSSLKGVCAHYCADIWAAADPRFAREGEYYNVLFGSQEDAGLLRFHDAWILPATLKGCLVEDVMTPHQSGYYGGTAPPSDKGNPLPVSFLSARGTFLIAIECDDPSEAGKRWATLGLELCKQALRDWGIGGKTRAGYGKMRTV